MHRRRRARKHGADPPQHWPFTVIDKDGSPYVEVEYLGEKKTFSPQEISAMVLVKVRPASILSLKTLLTHMNR